jgi:hypothetical protein
MLFQDTGMPKQMSLKRETRSHKVTEVSHLIHLKTGVVTDNDFSLSYIDFTKSLSISQVNLLIFVIHTHMFYRSYFFLCMCLTRQWTNPNAI